MTDRVRTNDDALKAAKTLIQSKRLAPAEILCRMVLESRPDEPRALEMLGRIGQRIGKRAHAATWFERANANAAKRGVARTATGGKSTRRDEPDDPKAEKFLLIKAWGYGFFSDVSHVLGALMLADLTRRTPVVHWGQNSLFSNDATQNAFAQYFELLNALTIDDLAGFRKSDYFPSKWSGQNLMDDNVRKWQGRDSRMAGLYYFDRAERVAVSDFFIGVPELVPWLEEHDPYAGMTMAQIFSHLIATYLRPSAAVTERVEDFYGRYLSDAPFTAAHVRGSDKVRELPNLDEVNNAYFGRLDRMMGKSAERVFLLTDSDQMLVRFRERYGVRLVTIDACRTSGRTGLHHQKWNDRVRLGMEIMQDVYLAIRARRFVGNGYSNPSCMIANAKDWAKGDCILLGPNFQHQRNNFLQFCPAPS